MNRKYKGKFFFLYMILCIKASAEEKEYLYKIKRKDTISQILYDRGCRHLYTKNWYLIRKLATDNGIKNFNYLTIGRKIRFTVNCDANRSEAVATKNTDDQSREMAFESVNSSLINTLSLSWVYGAYDILGEDNQLLKGSLVSELGHGFELHLSQGINDKYMTDLKYRSLNVNIKPELSNKILENINNQVTNLSIGIYQEKTVVDRGIKKFGIETGIGEELFYKGQNLFTYRIYKIRNYKVGGGVEYNFFRNTRFDISGEILTGITSAVDSDYFKFKLGYYLNTSLKLTNNFKRFSMSNKVFFNNRSIKEEQMKYKHKEIGFIAGFSMPFSDL